MDPSALRQEYAQASLDHEDLREDPMEQFAFWFEQTCNADLLEPNAMTLSTADLRGRVSSRTVLLKAYDAEGLVFYTNYESGKAQQIGENNQVALCFPWLALQRQVIICGRAEKVSTATSLKYFLSRPHGSQLGAWVSQQSAVISSRSLLETKLNEMKQKFKEGQVPLPDFWGGFRVRPETIEFWQGRPSRLHDRFRYSKKAGAQWGIERLSP